MQLHQLADSDDMGRAGGKDAGGKEGIKRSLTRRNSEKPTIKPVNKEITVLARLLIDLISVRSFFPCMSGSKAILYKKRSCSFILITLAHNY